MSQPTDPTNPPAPADPAGTAGTAGTATLPEVVIVGDPSAPPDPTSGTDAYADGYAAGLAGRRHDDSAYDPTAAPRYTTGYDAGAAARLLNPPAPEGSPAGEVAGGIAELLGPEAVAHLLELGPWPTLVALATSPGGDTPLPPPDVLLPVCSRTDHRLHGDALLDGGLWSGTATLSYPDAQAEGAGHADTWAHPGAVHTWSLHRGTWNPVAD